MRALLIALMLSTTLHAGVSIITGQIKDAQGNPINGTLVMRLPIPAQDPTTQSAIAPVPVTFSLINGQVTGGAPLYDLSTIQPSKLWYSARAYDTTGKLVFYGNYYVTGGIFNIGAATPTVVTTSNISFANLPAGGFVNGFGFVVPNAYTTISSAVSAASVNSSGPVIVLPTSTDTTAFTNANGVRITNYKQKNGIDSLFFRDASEWGVKADGKVVRGCSSVAGSPVITCGIGGFSSADVGKVVVARGSPGIGASTGRMFNWSVVSGGTGGTNGLQAVTFSGLSGCTSTFNQPVVYVNVVGGVPQPGPVTQVTGGGGIGCTGTPPTSGTVATVTGTVTFSGGQFIFGDLPSSIIAVDQTGMLVTLADNAQQTESNIALIYGSDDNDGVHNNWNAACSAMATGVGSSGVTSFGHLTFSGMSLVTHGIDCKGAGITIEGSGIASYTSGTGNGGSTIMYAGKSAGDHVIQMSGGAFAGMQRLRIDANSQALPYGLLLSQGVTGFGSETNAQDRFEQVVFGPRDDAEVGDFNSVPFFQSCIFSHPVTGNNDFNTFDNIYCGAAKVGWDTDNNQATNWKIGKVLNRYNEIGMATWGTEQIDDLYNEFNRLDISLGSPLHIGGNPGELTIQQYGSESSAEQIAASPLFATAGPLVNILNADSNSSCAGSKCLQANGVSIDFSLAEPQVFNYIGRVTGTVLRHGSCAPSTSAFNMTVPIDSITFANSYTSTCNNLFSARQTVSIPDIFDTGIIGNNVNVLTSLQDPRIAGILDETDNTSTKIIGSFNITSPTPPGQSGVGNFFYFVSPKGTTGATTYNYNITCIDGFNNETSASTFQITNGNATLNTTNFNRIYFWNHVGCVRVKLYGDEGIGGAIGLLATFRVVDLLQNSPDVPWTNSYINDQGQYTKNTAITSPAVTNSGALTVAGPTILSSKLGIADKGTCTMAAGTCGAITFPSGATYTAAPTCFATYTGTGTLAGTIKISSTTTTVTPASTTGTDTAQVNWACLGN